MHPLDTAPFGIRALAGVAAGGLTWIIAADLGGAVVKIVARQLRGPQLFGAALGYALIGLAVGVAAALHALTPWVIGICALVIIVLRAREYVHAIAHLPVWVHERQQRWRSLDLISKFAWVVATVALLIALCAAALPAVWWDPIAYHLPIVALALAHHTLAFDPGIPQTGFPLLAESAALPAYALAGSAGAAMATLGSGIVLALVCGELAESFASGARALATALVATSALLLWLAPSFYIDVPFALFAVAALAVPMLAARDNTPLLGSLSGAFAGAAAATKYPGLFVAVIAAVVALIYLPRRAVALASFAGGLLVVGLGWYARTYVLTGDPLYPFLGAMLASMRAQHGGVHNNVVQTFHAASPHFCGGGIAPVDLILLPWRMLVDPRMFCGDPGYALRLGIVVVIAALFIFGRLRAMIAIIAVLSIFWFYTAQQWRFLVDALALFAVVVAAGATLIRSQARVLVGAVLIVLCLVGALTQVFPWTIADASNSLVPAYRYMLGRETGTDYLRHRLESFAAAQWLANHDKDAKIFALDDVRDYYFGANVMWGNSPYPGGWRLDWSAPPAQRYVDLENKGFNYMVVNANPAYLNRTVVDVDWPALADDVKSGELKTVFAQNDVIVYQLPHAHGR